MKKIIRSAPRNRQIVGWREWVSLPDLGIASVKAKLDTGAKTSTLHAWDRERFEIDGAPWVRFHAHASESERFRPVQCAVPLTDCRWIANPGGTRELRYIITTTVGIGGETWPIELSLTERDDLKFRVLIGREAMRGRLIVDPRRSFRSGRRRTHGGMPNPLPEDRTLTESGR